MLAMVANDNAGCLNARGVWASIASMLAPTGGCVFSSGCLGRTCCYCSVLFSRLAHAQGHARLVRGQSLFFV